MSRKMDDHPLTRFKQELIQATVLDKTILDELISKFILSPDDREEITNAPSQPGRNKAVLACLISKPYNTFGLFGLLLEKIKKNNEDVQLIVQQMKDMDPLRFEQKSLDVIDLPNKEQDLEEWSRKHMKKAQLQKNYRIIVENVDCRGSLCDILVENEVITMEEREELCAEGLTRNESCRRMLGMLVRKDCSGFLEALRTDPAYIELADSINLTTVTETEMRLMELGEICFQKNVQDEQDEIRPEETNFLRFYLLCTNLATNAVRILFDNHVPSVDLHRHLGTHESDLKGKWKCFPEQLKVLFPDIPLLPQSIHFDFSLLYKLVRNTLRISAPTQGWGKEPLANDISDADDVERIRKFRNSLAHNEQTLFTESDFQKIWTELSQAIRRLSNGALDGEVDDLKNKRLDQNLRIKKVDIMKFRREVEDLKQEFDDMKTRVEKLEARSVQDHIPPNIREILNDQLKKWTEDEGVFYADTKVVKEALDKVKCNKIVTLIGGPGAGKTSLARHIALQYKKNEYEVVPVCSPNDIRGFCNTNVKQVFILDDVLGIFSLDMPIFNCINRFKDSILSALGVNSKLICTCRKLVFNEAKKKGCFVLENYSDVENEKNPLTEDNKLHILQNHCKKAKLSPNAYEGISLKGSHPMFPLLCKLFASSEKYQEKGQKFFDYPTDCVKEELNKMEGIHYAALVLCMLNAKRIPCSNEPLSSIDEALVKKVYGLCSDIPNPSNKQVNDALEHLSETYLTKSCDGFTFVHDSIYEIVAFHFGKENIELMINYMPSSFVCNKIILPGTDSSDELSISIKEDKFPELVDRIYRDIQDGHLYDVFNNPALSQKDFVIVFIECLKKRISYQRFRETFLEEIKGKTDHILRQSEEMAKIKENKDKAFDEEERQKLLLDCTCKWNKDPFEWSIETISIRIISFVIYYGHSYLLQSILDYVRGHSPLSSVIWSDLTEPTRLLTLAIFSKNHEVIRILLKYTNKICINMNSLTKFMDFINNIHRSLTPFEAACRDGNCDVVKFLFDHGADVNLCSEYSGSPLYGSSAGGHYDVVKFLVNHGADVNLCSEYSGTPLCGASKGGHFDVAKFLVDHGADVNLCSKYSRSPLYAASKGGHYDVAKFLVDHGAEVNLCSEYNESPLYGASEGGHYDVAKFLVDHGAEVNLCSILNGSPLCGASKGGHYDVAKFLVDHGAEVNLCGKYSVSPLHGASNGGHYDVVKFLVDHGAEVNLCSILNGSPLCGASKGGHYDVAKFLVDHGAEVNLCGKYSVSPLYDASERGHYDVAKFLVDHGGKINVCGYTNQSPNDIATEKNHLDIVDLLNKHN